MNSVRVLLNSAIDYAGLFPPAGLGMAEAMGNYASYRAGESSWALGRFVVPISRLAELESCLEAQQPEQKEQSWRLSALGGSDPEADFNQVSGFNRLYPESRIDTIELKVRSLEEMGRALKIFSGHLEIFLEIPAGENRAMFQAIAAGGARAKVRTGGISGDMFPAPAELAGFILTCADNHLSFKATAGLHHALRSIRPLTYEPASPSGMMHGFLNLLIASTFANAGGNSGIVQAILEEQTIEAFEFGEGGMSWRGRRVGNQQLREMRKRLLISFGACSFQEPISDLEALRLL